MTNERRPIPPDVYGVIAQHVPIVSVDLLVLHRNGILLGKRLNEPAKGEWFVPGGTVLKGETLEQAVHRVADEELGVSVTIDERLGTYAHFYDTAAHPEVDSKHYLATAFVVTPSDAEFRTDDQHELFEVFSSPFPPFHEYVERYLRDLSDRGYGL